MNIISNRDGSAFTLVTSVEEGVLQKTLKYYVHQGAKKLGPFVNFSQQEKGAWAAEDGKGSWYAGSASSITGPLPDSTKSVWARSMADRRLAFQADLGDSSYLKAGKELLGPFMNVRDIRPSPDDGSIAYIGMKDSRDYVIVDDSMYGPYDHASNLLWSPVGSVLAYTATIEGEDYVFVGGEKSGPYKSVGDMSFTPNGKTLVYCMDNSVVAGKEKLGPFDGTTGHVVFSPDGRHFAFSVYNKSLIIVRLDNGEQYGPFTNWHLPGYSYSPDGKTFFCYGYDESQKMNIYMGNEKTTIEDRMWAYPSIPFFSKDSRYKAFAVDVSDWELHVGDLTATIDPDLSCGLLSDGTPLYWASRDDGSYLVAGSSEQGPYAAAADVSDASSFRFLAYRDGAVYTITCPR